MARKMGEGHAQAMARLGLKELRNAMNPSRESVADTEIGLYGTQTQGEIAQARGSKTGLDAEEEKPQGKTSLAALRQEAQEKEPDHGLGQQQAKDRQQEMERE